MLSVHQNVSSLLSKYSVFEHIENNSKSIKMIQLNLFHTVMYKIHYLGRYVFHGQNLLE